MVFTNQPGEGVNYESQGWTLSDIIVLKFSPGLNPDPLHPKLYALKFWRPAPPKQPEFAL